MRSGQELILATKEYAHDFTAKSWWLVLSTAFLLALALSGTIWNFHLSLKAICSVLSGLLLLRLFVIYHDQQHHAILPKSKVAETFMRAFGIFALSASSVWRSSHNHHHNHNSKLRGSHIGSFPIMTGGQFLKSSPSDRRTYLLMRHPLTILFGYLSMFLYGMCINPFLNNPRKHFDCLLSLLIHVAIGVGIYSLWGWKALLLTQTLPHFITYAIGSYLFYAQHNFPGVAFEEKEGWTYEKAALESSSHLKTSRIMAWFTANIGLHHVHHLNAKIPFYRLGEVMRAMPELQHAKVTSLHPVDIIRCLRLKVWDAKSQRMVGLKELFSQVEAKEFAAQTTT
jgi:omega-6 fatty acid desaturase (delta-12 desaturase)